MKYNKFIDKALDIASRAHENQKDKAGKPYIFHPVRVFSKCQTDEERIVALLHDVIEDTEISTYDLLKEGFPTEIVGAILSISRHDNESYEDFICRVNKNPLGKKIKLYDLEDNLDVKRLEEITEEDRVRLNKYLKAYRYLKNN